MTGNIEKSNLRCADEQRGLDSRCLSRQATLQKTSEQMPQCAEPAQRHRAQGAGQCAVALRQGCEFCRRIEKLVEGATAAQHAIENIGSKPPHCKSRRFATDCLPA